MDSLFENEDVDPRVQKYLSAVDGAMAKIPADRRESLLLELRGHVDRLVDNYSEHGKSTPTAVDAALAKMGDAKKLGRDYVLTWYRSTLPGSVLAAVGLIVVVDSCINTIQFPTLMKLGLTSGHPASVALIACLVTLSVLRGLAGVVVGWYSPRGAVAGAVLHSVLNAAAILASLANPLIGLGAIGYQAILTPVLTIGSAAIAARIRMRKLAGI